MPSVWLYLFELPKHHHDWLIRKFCTCILETISYEIACCVRPMILVVLSGCLVLATIIDFLPQARERWRHKCIGPGSTQRRERIIASTKDLEALVDDEEDHWRIRCGASAPDGVYLILTRVNALPIWLYVHAHESISVESHIRVMTYSLYHPLAMVLQSEQLVWSLLAFIFLLIMLSISILALLLVARRSGGLQKSIILAVYSLSVTLGVLFWASMGMTEVETFAVFIPLTMGVGASVGSCISNAYSRRRME